MKNYIILGFLAAALSANAQYGAGNFTTPQQQYQNFINPYANSITVSNKLMGVTNLNSTWLNGSATPLVATNSVGAGTNVWGISFTNNYGVSCYVTNNAALTNTFGTFEQVNLFQDVLLPGGRSDATPALWNNILSATTVSNSIGSIQIKFLSKAAANSAVNFYFVPLYDGTNEVNTPASEEFVIGVTAQAGIWTSCSSNLPNKYLHAKAFRLRAANNTDTDAASAVDVTRIGFVAFSP